jgi:hypothetical protein
MDKQMKDNHEAMEEDWGRRSIQDQGVDEVYRMSVCYQLYIIDQKHTMSYQIRVLMNLLREMEFLGMHAMFESMWRVVNLMDRGNMHLYGEFSALKSSILPNDDS